MTCGAVLVGGPLVNDWFSTTAGGGSAATVNFTWPWPMVVRFFFPFSGVSYNFVSIVFFIRHHDICASHFF
jgi:hypothetical protein